MTQSTLPRAAPAPATRRDRSRPVVPTPGQHSLATSVLLHLSPGLVLSAFIVMMAPTVQSWGLDPVFALFLGVGVVLAPLELGYLAVHARRTTGSWSPLAAVYYREKLPLRRLLPLAAGLAAFMLLFVVAHMAFLDRLIAPAFSWMPDALFTMSTVEVGAEPLVGGPLVVMIVAIVTFNGFVGPIVEELYFRGHLLPRIDRYGRGAPVLNTALFTLYHVHNPWRWPQIFLGGLPLYWLTWRKRSVALSMTAHIMINIAFSFLMVAGYLQARA